MLPFGQDAFFALFEQYNRAIWPAQIAACVLAPGALAYTGGVTPTDRPLREFPRLEEPGIHIAAFHGSLGAGDGGRALALAGGARLPRATLTHFLPTNNRLMPPEVLAAAPSVLTPHRGARKSRWCELTPEAPLSCGRIRKPRAIGSEDRARGTAPRARGWRCR